MPTKRETDEQSDKEDQEMSENFPTMNWPKGISKKSKEE